MITEKEREYQRQYSKQRVRFMSPEERERRRQYAARYRAEGRHTPLTTEQAREAAHRQRAAHPNRYMLERARARAKALDIPCTITIDDFSIPEFCPVFPWLKLEFSIGPSRPDNCPSLDRVIPELGYVPGNVRVISMKANRIKSNASPAEIEAIHTYIQGHIK